MPVALPAQRSDAEDILWKAIRSKPHSTEEPYMTENISAFPQHEAGKRKPTIAEILIEFGETDHSEMGQKARARGKAR
jgi:hypothetical protein